MKNKVAKKQRTNREKRTDVGPGKPPKDKQFKPGVSGNPNGRPRKYVSALGKEFGYTNTEVKDAMKGLLGMSEAELQDVSDNKKATALERAISKALLRAIKKGEVNTIEAVITRPFGSPNKPIDVKGSMKVDSVVDYSKLSEATLRELVKHKKH